MVKFTKQQEKIIRKIAQEEIGKALLEYTKAVADAFDKAKKENEIENSYYCKKCKCNHYEFGKIGQEHIKFKRGSYE